jgi:ATP-dependent DNA helicase RecG
MELIDLKGVGPKRAALFSELGIRTPEDLLTFYPREYLDYSAITPIANAEDGERVSIRVTAQADPTVYYFKGKYMVSIRVADASGKASLKWINQPYRANQFHAGDVIYANAIASKKHGTVFYNPQISRAEAGIIPVYESVKGLTQPLIRESVKEILQRCTVPETLPEEWIERYRLIPFDEALREVHFPSSADLLNQAKRRISFEEAFLYFTAIRASKADRNMKNGFAFRTDNLLESFLSTVPFAPTDAQLRTMHEIESDMRSDRSMNRLIQGDVGSGKTLVAEYALFIAEQNGRQGVMLAPTELLAEQHFRTMRRRFPDACLYVGGMPAKEKKHALERIASGEAKIVIGTHALLSDTVRFRHLGLVVTDEQHRFGVMQRAKIEMKGMRPDVLVMSATPIPRTLALLLYADLDLSIIDRLPPGRQPIKTHYVPQTKRNDLYRHLAENAKNGERAYVVCPLIEPTEGYEGLSLQELHEELKTRLQDTLIGILHGQMSDAEKQHAMEAFRNGSVPILISTTVVEVGVDVPEATSMVIEGADHFGLATLHQLRGRVGRGDRQSHCYLLAKKMTEHAKQRIEAMLESTDGFAIAQMDLEMRGSGDLFGVRQSGDSEMNGILSSCTVEIIEAASSAANDVFTLPTLQYNTLLEKARERYRTLNQVAHN